LWWKRQASPLPPLWHAVSEEPPPFRLAVRGDGGSPGRGERVGRNYDTESRAWQGAAPFSNAEFRMKNRVIISVSGSGVPPRTIRRFSLLLPDPGLR
jgi:hypothetical protein